MSLSSYQSLEHFKIISSRELIQLTKTIYSIQLSYIIVSQETKMGLSKIINYFLPLLMEAAHLQPLCLDKLDIYSCFQLCKYIGRPSLFHCTLFLQCLSWTRTHHQGCPVSYLSIPCFPVINTVVTVLCINYFKHANLFLLTLHGAR